MPDDDEELRRRLHESLLQAKQQQAEREGAFDRAIDDAYQNPQKAREQMGKLGRRGGLERLANRLQQTPQMFGLRRGSPLTRDGWTKDAWERGQLAKQQMARLPDLARGLGDANARLRDAAAAHEKVAPTGPTPGNSFSQRVARSRDSRVPDPGTQDRENAETLERWRRERQKEKERGR